MADPDLRDVRVLAPRVRRAIEGPAGPPPGTLALSDEQVEEVTADAVADAILYSGGLFGHQLVVTERDPDVGFPLHWQTEVQLDEWEGSFVAAQAALTYFFHLFRDKKTSEVITSEGRSWEYQLSATLLNSQLKMLQDQRNAALTALRQLHPVLDRFASVLAVRDLQTQTVLEWWSKSNPYNSGFGLGGGQEASVIPAFQGP